MENISTNLMMFEDLKLTNIMVKNTNLSGQPVLCQLLSFIPPQLVELSVNQHQSDRYYKTMTSYKQLVFLLYGVVTKCHSLRNLCKNLLFLEDKLCYLGIHSLPSVSTLSDANINRDSEFFATLYNKLYDHYRDYFSGDYGTLLKLEGIDVGKVELFDSSTVSLFVEVFKGAGRNTLSGKKKGGLKIHTKMPLSGFVPDLIHLTEAACNDKVFLGQLHPPKGTIYIFDKGYASYQVWLEWTQKGVFFVTRLNENADYRVLTGQPNHISEYADGGIIADQQIELKVGTSTLIARLITYKDPVSGKVLRFVTNMMDYQPATVALLYKYRWNIEVLFKQLKQNFELCYFFSDSTQGIKSQVWVALIAHLIFTVIHRQVKECELFVTLVSLASNNMGSYVSLIQLVQRKKLTGHERDLNIVQLELFNLRRGGVFDLHGKSP